MKNGDEQREEIVQKQKAREEKKPARKIRGDFRLMNVQVKLDSILKTSDLPELGKPGLLQRAQEEYP